MSAREVFEMARSRARSEMGPIRRVLRRLRMSEAGARNSKKDKERLVQIVMSALSNLSMAEREQVLKDALKEIRAKKSGGKK